MTHSAGHDRSPVVSVVMPCLNEADTVAACVSAARQAFVDGIHLAFLVAAGIAFAGALTAVGLVRKLEHPEPAPALEVAG